MTGHNTQAEAEAARLYAAAVAFLAADDVDRAASMCREVLARTPAHGGALHLLGVVAYQAGRRDEALALLSRAAQLPDARALHALSYADLLWESGCTEEALAAARAACARHPLDPATRAHLGSLLLRMHHAAQAHLEFTRALALDPACAGARHGLASSLAELGDSDAAIAQLERIIADDPGAVQSVLLLARLLGNLGRHEDAQQRLEHAVKTRPDELALVLELCSGRMHRGQTSRALRAIEAIRPEWQSDCRVVTLKAHLLRGLDRNDDAILVCEQARRDGVSSPELDHALGLALHAAGRSGEGLAALARSACDAANPAAALSDRGVLLSDLGRVDEASAAFDAALEHAPSFAEAWYNKANAKTYAPADPDMAAMERLIAQPPPAHDRMLLHFALGKAYGDADQPDSAFPHWHAGNRLKRALIDYDRSAITRRIDVILASDWRIEDPMPSGSMRTSNLPVFIVGMPRSGSTLVEQILAAHPAVHAGGEMLQLRGLIERYAPHEIDGLRRNCEALAATMINRLSGVGAGHLRVIDKDLQNFLHVGAINALFPHARIIHCRRNPLDTCVSAYTKLFAGDLDFTYDLSELGHYYREYARLMHHWRMTIPSHAFLEVEYERLVTGPRHEIARLIEFVGLDWDERCLRHFELDRVVTTASQHQVRRPIYRTSVGRSARLHAHIGPLIDALGELASSVPGPPPYD